MDENIHGQNEHSPKNYEHSAICSWSGYIYQGLCALHYMLELIKEELVDQNDNYLGCRLYLDAHEDFSIKKGEEIISLHQCKLYKKKTKHLEVAVDELVKKKKYLIKKFGTCAHNARLYFHSNQSVNPREDVIEFKDSRGKSLLDGKGLIQAIEEIIIFLIEKLKLPTNPQTVLNRLISLVDSKVIEIHQNYRLLGSKCIYEVATAVSSSLSYEEIKNCLIKNEYYWLEENWFWQKSKFCLIEALEEHLESLNEVDPSLNSEPMKKAIEHIGLLTPAGFEDLIRRLMAHNQITIEEKTLRNCFNIQTASKLLGLIEKIKHELSQNLSWNRKNKHETPFIWDSHGSENEERKIRMLILSLLKNAPNLDCLREYDWLVTDELKEIISDITRSNYVINQWDESRPEQNNIFNLRGVGLLPVENFNSDNYD